MQKFKVFKFGMATLDTAFHCAYKSKLSVRFFMERRPVYIESFDVLPRSR